LDYSLSLKKPIQMRTLILLVCSIFLFSCVEEELSDEKVLRPVTTFFTKNKAKVLVVGTFHFNYPGLDAHKTVDSDKIDVLVEPKKSEVIELVEYIKKFNPTKIAIEATEKWDAMGKLKNFKSGKRILGRDEREQLGFRIVNDLKLDTIYSLDAKSFADDIDKRLQIFSTELWKDYDWKSDDPIENSFNDLFSYQNKIIKEYSLLSVFKYLNSKEYHQYDYGSYLIGDFKLDEHRGADVLSIYWYNRNLRIFRKLQDITESKDDRILLIFGNGHAALLRQFIESSPEYEFVEFDSL
jgi:hypothetical protein